VSKSAVFLNSIFARVYSHIGTSTRQLTSPSKATSDKPRLGLGLEAYRLGLGPEAYRLGLGAYGLGVGLDVGLGVGLGLGLASQLLSRFNVSFCMVTAASFPFELPSVISTFNRFEISLGAIQLAVYDDPLDDFVCSDAVTHDAELHGELSPLTTPAVACRNAPVPSPDSVSVTVVLALYDATAGVDTIAVVDVCTVMPMMLERWETSLPVAPLEVRVVRSH